jgi:tRNA dimethylallyltransferase
MPLPLLEEDMRPPLILIVGPTGVGKTEAAIRLAERLDGEIISADSRLFYRGMDIGTAKPSPKERRRVPHHLIDVAWPDEIWSLAVFQERARQAIAGVHAAGRLPFLVGGTGQYVRAVAQGWQPPAVEPDSRLRAALESWANEIGAQGLYDRLQKIDPEAAEKIDARNLRRTVRALEVIFTTGQRFSEQRSSSPSPYRQLSLGLSRPRPELYARIDRRIDAMLAAGLVDETHRLLGKGYSPDLPSMSAIGYREIIAHLLGVITLQEAVIQIRRNTRTYVRRQANWFKPDDPEIHWCDLGGEGADEIRMARSIDQMEQLIRSWRL